MKKLKRDLVSPKACSFCGLNFHIRAWEKPNEFMKQTFCSRDCSSKSRALGRDAILKRYVLSPSGCWEWSLYRDKKGYGRMSEHMGEVLTHRISYLHHVGPIPNGLHVLHRCDNPCCINPNHLFLGTNLDNSNDKIAKGRARGAVGAKNCKAKLSEEDIVKIRNDPRSGSVIGREYGMSQPMISAIKRRVFWKHVP